MGKKQPEISLPPVLSDLAFCYGAAIEIFSPEKVGEVLKKAIPRADVNMALLVLALSGFIVFVMALATSLVSVYMVNYASDLVSEASGVPQPKLELDSLVPVVAYQFTLYALIGFLMGVLFEALAYSIFRVSGGRGKLHQQLFIAAIISLSFSFASVLSLLMPLPLLNFVGGLAILLVTLYLVFYVTAKAYSMIHGVSFMHALVVLIVAGIPRVAAILFIMSTLASVFGLASPVDVPQGG